VHWYPCLIKNCQVNINGGNIYKKMTPSFSDSSLSGNRIGGGEEAIGDGEGGGGGAGGSAGGGVAVSSSGGLIGAVMTTFGVELGLGAFMGAGSAEKLRV
jgi:hypothetical protein